MHKIIVVDDEYYVREGIIKNIPWREHGFTIAAEAENGREALERIKKHRPDILITDVKMPVMDGIELIRRVRSEGFAMGVVILSCYDDFNYAREAIHLEVAEYILKLSTRPDDILKAVQSVARKIESRQARDAAPPLPLPEPVLPAQEQALEAMAAKLPGCVACLPHWGGDGEGPTPALVRACLPDPGMDALFFEGGDRQLMVFLPCSPGDARRDLLHALVRALRQQGYRCPVGVSQTGDAARMAGEAWTAAQAGFYRPAPALNVYSPAPEVCPEPVNETELRTLFEAGDTDGLLRELSDHLDSLWGSPLHRIRDDAIEMIMILARCVRRDGLPVTARADNLQAVTRMIGGLNSFDTLKASILELARAMADQYARGASRDCLLVRKTKQYIQQHYKQDITLSLLADETGVHGSYLSRTFKSHAGKEFSTYLNEFRIEKAKQMLAETSLNVYHIAEECGYHNQYYFSRVFKKYVGLTPLAYRNKFGSCS